MRKMTSTYLLLHLSHHIVCEHTVSWYWVYISGIQLLMNTLVPKSSPFFLSFQMEIVPSMHLKMRAGWNS